METQIHQPLIRCVGIDFSDPVLHLGRSFTETLKTFFGEKRGLNCPTRMFLINRVQIQTSKSRNIKGNVYVLHFSQLFFSLTQRKDLTFQMSKLKYPQHLLLCQTNFWKRNNELDKVLVSQKSKSLSISNISLC